MLVLASQNLQLAVSDSWQPFDQSTKLLHTVPGGGGKG